MMSGQQSKGKPKEKKGPKSQKQNNQTIFHDKALRQGLEDAIACYPLLGGTYAWPLHHHPTHVPKSKSGQGGGTGVWLKFKFAGTSTHVSGYNPTAVNVAGRQPSGGRNRKITGDDVILAVTASVVGTASTSNPCRDFRDQNLPRGKWWSCKPRRIEIRPSFSGAK